MKKCHEIEALGTEITRCGEYKTPVKDYPEPLKIEDMDKLIDCFKDRVDRWIFKPAEILLEQKLEEKPEEKDPDVDFAILAILNAVPEMLAQYLQGHNKRGKPVYKKGLQYIFPQLKAYQHKKLIMNLLFGSLRSKIAHVGLTNPPILLERKIKDAIIPCHGRENKIVVIINVPEWYDQTKKRVNDYICKLRNESNTDLRCKFRKRITQ